jgi:hypothetical protein
MVVVLWWWWYCGDGDDGGDLMWESVVEVVGREWSQEWNHGRLVPMTRPRQTNGKRGIDWSLSFHHHSFYVQCSAVWCCVTRYLSLRYRLSFIRWR